MAKSSVLLLIAGIINLLNMPNQLSVQALMRCSDGDVAVVACIPHLNGTQLTFVCNVHVEPTLGCEQIEQSFYCCKVQSKIPTPLSESTSADGSALNEEEVSTNGEDANLNSVEVGRPCGDASLQCTNATQLCRHPLYRHLMEELCPHSCDLCATRGLPEGSRTAADGTGAVVSGSSPSSKSESRDEVMEGCEDKNRRSRVLHCFKQCRMVSEKPYRCEVWQSQGFCSAEVYTPTIKASTTSVGSKCLDTLVTLQKTYCAKSCDLC